jgi:geranylgeranyl diphosphate synthase type II
VHKVFGEATALLVGDAFIVQAFHVLTVAASSGRGDGAADALALLAILASAAGTTHGLLAGQAWESESEVSLEEYHRSKTASLFEAAAAMGATAAGAPAKPWRRLGELLGRAYQAADDLDDALSRAEVLGKPVGRDRVLRRPNLALSSGPAVARGRLDAWLEEALASIPRSPEDSLVRAWVKLFAARLKLAGLPARPARSP